MARHCESFGEFGAMRQLNLLDTQVFGPDQTWIAGATTTRQTLGFCRAAEEPKTAFARLVVVSDLT